MSVDSRVEKETHSLDAHIILSHSQSTTHIHAKNCPECGSSRLYKDGQRYVDGLPIQRFLCRECGRRFSDSGNKYKRCPTERKTIQIGALSQVVKNLDSDLAESRSAGEIGKTTQDVKGSLTIYAAKQLTMGLAEETITRRVATLSRLHSLGANLFNPESVWKTINAAIDKEARPWSDGTRALAAQAYLKFCKIMKIAIPEDLSFRKWKNQSKIPWIPLESEVDQLIAACRLRMATFLQLLKETGVRSGEAWRLEWKDIDVEHGIVTVNKPEKNGLPRQLKVSSKLVAMLNSLPKVNGKVWNGNVRCFTSSFMGQRNRIAKKLQNPRMKQIHFHTLRHFFATMLYHKTLNLLEVQQKLGHRSISNTSSTRIW